MQWDGEKFLEKPLLIPTNVLLSITACRHSMPLYALAPVVWFWKPPQRWTWIKELKNKDIYRHNTYIDKNTYIITLANMPIHPLGNWNCGWRLRWRGIGLETIPAIGEEEKKNWQWRQLSLSALFTTCCYLETLYYQEEGDSSRRCFFCVPIQQ